MSFKALQLSLGAVVVSGLVFVGSIFLSRESTDISDLTFNQITSPSEAISASSESTKTSSKPALDLNNKGTVISTLRAHGCTINFPQNQEAFMNQFISKVPKVVLKNMGNQCFGKNKATVMLKKSFWPGGHYWSVY